MLILFMGVGTLAACRSEPLAPPRNLLLVTLDTLRADHLGAYGYSRPTSPAMDAFAESAVVFEDATCSMPTTLPSHLSMLTGLRPFQHGVWTNGIVPQVDGVSLFDLLGEAGWTTHGIVSSRVLHPMFLVGAAPQGMDFPDVGAGYEVPAEWATEKAGEWLAANGTQRFVLWVHYYDTHEPYTPPESFRARFDRGYEGPLPDAMSVEALLALNAPGGRQRLTPADVAHLVDLYDAEVAYLDSQVGRLLARLQALGLAGDTAAVLVGDHGQAIGDGDYFGHGGRLLEPIVKVPLMIRVPGWPGGRRTPRPVETVDLLPTLAELFGLEAPPGLPGRSLLMALRGERLPRSRLRVVESRGQLDDERSLGVALLGPGWKAVFRRDRDGAESRFLGRGRAGLDGRERLAPDSRQARALEALVAQYEGAARVETEPPDDELLEMLRALGYAD